MHDLIRELAIAVSKKISYVESSVNEIPDITEHIGINCDGSEQENNIIPIKSNQRSVMLYGDRSNCSYESISNSVAKPKGLRLLNLSKFNATKILGDSVQHWWSFSVKRDVSILDAICQLSHLRFVDLSSSGIEFIPDKFCELWHLQVLDVRGCVFKTLPKNMNKLINLRHLYASAETVSQISGIGKMTNLQELDEFCIEKSEGHRISELRDMNEIRGHLLLTNLQNVTNKEEAAKCRLDRKRYLKSIKLEFRPINYDVEEVLEALKPSSSVEILTIEGYETAVDSLPGWILSTQNRISNLKHITVTNFILYTLPAFGELPSLEVLSFERISKLETVDNEFYGRSDVAFPSLKELRFYFMSSWRTWSDAPAEKKIISAP